MRQKLLIKYGSEHIRYTILTRPNRQTLGIEVHPDGAVVVLVPPNCDLGVVETKLRHRASWISRQLSHFSVFPKFSATPQYLGGETFRYLGRRYRLRIIRGDLTTRHEHVELSRGRITVFSRTMLTRHRARSLVESWYRTAAHAVFSDALNKAYSPFSRRAVQKPEISIRRMKRRWGSLSNGGRMTLNVRLVEAPRECVEYVITHELCHLVHHDHGPSFRRLIARIMPDWERRKRRLEHALAS
jgi:predicted metal-dependent hydrolase